MPDAACWMCPNGEAEFLQPMFPCPLTPGTSQLEHPLRGLSSPGHLGLGCQPFDLALEHSRAPDLTVRIGRLSTLPVAAKAARLRQWGLSVGP